MEAPAAASAQEITLAPADTATAPAPKPAGQPQAQSAPKPAEPPQEQPAPEPPAEKKPAPTAADASAYIGQSASSLISALGQPGSTDYASSCLGEGEDGELRYDGFTVYTYRENGTETVQAVE